MPAPIIPEVDHLLGHRLGPESRLTFCSGLSEGHYLVVDLPRVAALNRQFAELRLGFVDAAIVALAETLGLERIATTDISSRSRLR